MLVVLEIYAKGQAQQAVQLQSHSPDSENRPDPDPKFEFQSQLEYLSEFLSVPNLTCTFIVLQLPEYRIEEHPAAAGKKGRYEKRPNYSSSTIL